MRPVGIKRKERRECRVKEMQFLRGSGPADQAWALSWGAVGAMSVGAVGRLENVLLLCHGARGQQKDVHNCYTLGTSGLLIA